MTYPVVDRRARRRGSMYGGGFLPGHLFRSGEQGVWYDPSDLSTLFQDSAGTTPVTADGDPVALMLDKRKGLKLGTERSGDVGFDNPAYWDNNNGSTSVSGGEAVWSAAASGNRVASIGFTVELGLWYVVSFNITSISQGSLRFADSVGNALSPDFNTTGVKTAYFRSTGTNEVWIRAVGTTTATVTSLSVRELPGFHSTNSVSAQRPVFDDPSKSLEFDAVDDKLTTTLPDLGADVTIAYADPGVGAVIQTSQTIGAGSYNWDTNHAGLIIVDRSLTASETSSITAYLNSKAGV